MRAHRNLCWLMVGVVWLTFTQTVSWASSKTPVLHKTISVSTEMPPVDPQKQIAGLRQLLWQERPAQSSELTLDALLTATVKNNGFPRDRTSQKLLLQTSAQYYDLMRRWMSCYTTFQVLLQKRAALESADQKFTSGEILGPALLQAQSDLILQGQKYREAIRGYGQASQILAIRSGLDATTVYYPSDLHFENKRFFLPMLQAIPKEPDDVAITTAIFKNGPGLNSLLSVTGRYQPVMRMAGILNAPKLPEKREHNIKASVAIQALVDYRAARDHLEAVGGMLLLAEKTLRQAEVSVSSGFLSEKDRQDTEAAFAQTQAAYANAQIDLNLAQIQLLFLMGDLKPERLGLSSKRQGFW